jgi:hypothetical protein
MLAAAARLATFGDRHNTPNPRCLKLSVPMGHLQEALDVGQEKQLRDLPAAQTGPRRDLVSDFAGVPLCRSMQVEEQEQWQLITARQITTWPLPSS